MRNHFPAQYSQAIEYYMINQCDSFIKFMFIVTKLNLILPSIDSFNWG